MLMQELVEVNASVAADQNTLETHTVDADQNVWSTLIVSQLWPVSTSTVLIPAQEFVDSMLSVELSTIILYVLVLWDTLEIHSVVAA